MSLTKSRLEQAHRHTGQAGGLLALALARSKLNRMELQETIHKLKNAIMLLEDVLNAKD